MAKSVQLCIWRLALNYAALATAAAAATQPAYCPATAATITNRTASNPHLQTWWHSTSEINTQTQVAVGNVRRSHLYTVQISSTSNATDYYDSFVYETIPRSGNGQICYPGDPSVMCPEDDGVTIESDVGVTMAWTQFLYGTDAVVKISKTDGSTVKASQVVIRPTTLQYTVQTCSKTNSVIIAVPYNAVGTRFSVEFQNDLWTYREQNQNFVQDVDSSGVNYVSQYTKDMPIVGVEPRNGLLIFASPFPSDDLVPSSPSNTYEVPQGLVDVNALNSTTSSIVSFGPGVYYMTGTAHGLLSPSVNWVYFAPGSYVKGAIEYTTEALEQYATGFGVLSGEQYVYQANVDANYSNTKSDATSLHMWRGLALTGGKWTLNGLTLNAPPFNSMDFYGDLDGFTTEVWDYKQVGAFFYQTDGLEIYPNSYQHDIFYHANDDTIKTYYSNVVVENLCVWKVSNGGVIEMGWDPRNMTNITVNNLDVIHARYFFNSDEGGLALIGGAPNYADVTSETTASPYAHISNYTVSNLRSEGISPALMRIFMLSNIDNMTVSNVWVEGFSPAMTGIGTSHLEVFTDEFGTRVQLGADSPDHLGLVIEGFSVGNPPVSVTIAQNNWQVGKKGELDFEGLTGDWTAVL